jgi:hypothetical protein
MGVTPIRAMGTPNKPKPIVLVPSAQTRALLLTAADVLTPKAVMMEGMKYFYQKAQERERSKDFDGAQEAWIRCVEVAVRVAPFVHPRLLAIESRGDLTDDRVPFVLRAPAVMDSSQKWQEMVSQQGAALDNLDKAERKAVQEHLRYREATEAIQQHLRERSAPRAAGGHLEGMPHPAMPSGSAETDVSPMPTPLRADPETGRIGPAEPTPTVAPSPRMMPVGPVVVKPSGSEEWLEAVARDRAKKVG